MTQSLTASCIAGALMLFDVGVLILNRYILLDPILLFFISFATYSMAKFRNCSRSPFSQVNEISLGKSCLRYHEPKPLTPMFLIFILELVVLANRYWCYVGVRIFGQVCWTIRDLIGKF